MGFIDSGTTIEIKGKLTPSGRQKLANGRGLSITNFILGDSDANYNVFEGLSFGEVPDISGDNFGLSINNGGSGYQLTSRLIYKGGVSEKPVQNLSSTITSVAKPIGYSTVTHGSGAITQLIVNRNNINTDRFVNLFKSFNLPINTSEALKYTSVTSQNGGFSDTALSGLSSENILVIGLNSAVYGELLDGKSLRIDLSTTLQSYTIFSTYENKNTPLAQEDGNPSDTSRNLLHLGPNRALLFSDEIRRPNNDISRSWATGYATQRPFSSNNKRLYNFRSNPNTNSVVDKAVGVAYLDKGFIVITEPDIVNNFDLMDPSSTATTITFNSYINSVSQKVTCIADRNEFTISDNNTFSSGTVPRITEIGLLDSTGDLIAIAKTNRTYYKPSDDLVVFNLSIEY